MTTQKNELAVLKDQTVSVVEKRIGQLVENGQLVLPRNYSAANALQAAWLTLQEVKTKDKKPALEACTRNSVVQALYSMVVQALDPGKKQGYFIVYGNSLVFQRSYFGTLAVAKRMADVTDAVAEIVYEGDTFEYEIDRGTKRVVTHRQSLDAIDTGNVRAAYAVVMFNDGRDYTELMTWDQIQAAWSKSKMNPNGKDSTHSQFQSEMVKRTVLNRALKRYINSSNDDHLFLQEFNRELSESVEASIEEDVKMHANQDLLEIPETLDDAVEDDRTIDVDQPDEPETVQQGTLTGAPF
jgi:recombination protein RecT